MPAVGSLIAISSSFTQSSALVGTASKPCRQNGDIAPDYGFEGTSDAASLFTYHLHAMPNEVSNRISTSTTMAAWNAAVYVAQIEDERSADVLMEGKYLDATAEVVLKQGGLWFQDESFVVVRHAS